MRLSWSVYGHDRPFFRNFMSLSWHVYGCDKQFFWNYMRLSRRVYGQAKHLFLGIFETVMTRIWSWQALCFWILRIYHDTYMVEINKFWNVWVRMTRKWWVCRVTNTTIGSLFSLLTIWTERVSWMKTETLVSMPADPVFAPLHHLLITDTNIYLCQICHSLLNPICPKPPLTHILAPSLHCNHTYFVILSTHAINCHFIIMIQ